MGTFIIDLDRPDRPAFRWAAGVLVVLWLFLAWWSWAHWGSPTVDCGREAYVPSVLAQGKTLYKDVWYPYGPAAPYLNSLLFRLFGVHLNVLYVAGLASVLLYALPLFWLASRFCPLPGAFCVGLALVIQAFGPTIFSFPLPYSFAAVYGAVFGSFFLLFAIKASLGEHAAPVFGTGVFAALALLTKPEFGAACYAALGVLLLGRYLHYRCARTVRRDLLLVLPGVLLATLVVAWMVSLEGIDFLTQKNIMSWPDSYFMQTYGQQWLRKTGFSLSPFALRNGGWAVAVYFVFWGVAGSVIKYSAARIPQSRLMPVAAAVSVVAIVGAVAAIAAWGPVTFRGRFLAVFLPRSAVAIVAAALPFVAWKYWKSGFSRRFLALLLVCCFAVSLAFRFLFELSVRGYSVYYNGSVLLALFTLFVYIALPGLREWPSRLRTWAPILLFVPVVFAIVFESWVYLVFRNTNDVPLRTERGVLHMDARKAEGYRQSIEIMQEAQRRGEAIMVMPEDTMLYFLSGVNCPTRVFAFTPGLLAPGEMTDDLIREMDSRDVRYLLLSNRRFPEYGAPEFGVDFDQPVGEHIRQNYHQVRTVPPGTEEEPRRGWEASLWERNR